MFSRLKSLSVLYKYILSYSILVLFLLSMLISWLYNDNISYIRNDIEDMNVYRLEQAVDIFEARFRELHMVAYNIASDYRLKPNYLQRSKYSEIEGKISFDFHTRSNVFANQMFLYLRNENKVYAKDGVMTIDVLMNSFYMFDEVEQAFFYQQINSITAPSIIPAKKVQTDTLKCEEVITYLYPLPLNNSQPYGTLIFSIPKTTITNLINNILGEYEGNALILDQNMKIIASIGEEVLSIPEIIDIVSQYNNMNSKIFTYKEYSVIYTISSSTGWKYILSIPTEQFLIKVIRQKTLIFQIALTILILGIGVAVVMASINYRPIKRLLLIAGSVNQKDKSNEIDIIENTILTYINTNQKLQNMVNSQVSYVRERTFELLLDGKIKEDEAYGLLKQTGVHFDMSYYCVAIIDNYQYMDDAQRSQFHQKVLTVVNELDKSDISCYLCAIERINERSITIVMNFSNQGDEENIAKNIIGSIRRDECNEINSLVVSLGRVYPNIMGLKKSLLEAMAAMEYASMKRKYGIIDFDDIKDYKSTEYWYPVEEQLYFQQALKQGDSETALQILDKICTINSNRNNSILMLKYVCFNIINSVIKVVAEISPEILEKIDVKEVMDFNVNGLDQFRKGLEIIILDLCDSIKRKKMSNNERLKDQILEYIKLNYKDYNLSLETIAEKFSVSPYYVSRFFSEQTNCNFKDYIADLRIKEAKRLLANTELSINDIVQNIGYVNVSSFIRKFKKSEGVTPGEYRKICNTINTKPHIDNRAEYSS